MMFMMVIESRKVLRNQHYRLQDRKKSRKKIIKKIVHQKKKSIGHELPILNDADLLSASKLEAELNGEKLVSSQPSSQKFLPVFKDSSRNRYVKLAS
jgi:fatty acid-binding protein DegV